MMCPRLAPHPDSVAEGGSSPCPAPSGEDNLTERGGDSETQMPGDSIPVATSALDLSDKEVGPVISDPTENSGCQDCWPLTPGNIEMWVAPPPSGPQWEGPGASPDYKEKGLQYLLLPGQLL